jgi:phage shock protein E
MKISYPEEIGKKLVRVKGVYNCTMITNLTAKEFAQKIDEEKGLILDVRTPEEFIISHIKNALNIDFYRDDFEEKLKCLDKNKTYFVYCKSGARSSRTVEIMSKQKFRQIYHLEKGLVSWINNNLLL